MLSTVLGIKRAPAQRALWSQPRPVERATGQSGRREQLREGRGSITEEVTGASVCRRGEVEGAAGASTWHGQRGQGEACPPTSAKAGGLASPSAGAALTPSGPARSSLKDRGAITPGDRPPPGPGVVASCPVEGKSGSSPVAPRGPQRLGSQYILHWLVLPSRFLGSHHNNPPMSLPQVLFSGNPAKGEERTPRCPPATELTLPPAES